MEDWTFLTSHARAMLFMAADPGLRLRDLAVDLDVTERTAFGIVVDLTDAGYVVREKDGRRNHYRIRSHLLLHDSLPQQRTVGELVELFTVPPAGPRPPAEATAPPRSTRHQRPAGLPDSPGYGPTSS